MKRIFLLAAAVAALTSTAGATTISIYSASSIAGAVADENTWLAANFSAGATATTLENFESYGYGPDSTLNSGAGIFSAEAGGQSSLTLGTGTNQFTILNSADSPFEGRFDTTPGGQNWLDSNDITKLKLTTTLSTLYFFITDVDDVDGTLQITTADGTTASNFTVGAPNGNIYFVGITSSNLIGSVEWLNNSRNDGFGLDDFGTVNTIHPSSVPEPASWMAMIGGLFLIGGRRLYAAKKRV